MMAFESAMTLNYPFTFTSIILKLSPEIESLKSQLTTAVWSGMTLDYRKRSATTRQYL